MNNLYTIKGKFLLIGFAGISFCYAMTGAAFLFAGEDGSPAQAVDQVSSQEPVPVVILKSLDGEATKLMSVKDFMESAAANPNLTTDDIAKIVKLKNEIDLGKAQIDLFKKLTEKKEDPFFKGAIKQGGNWALDLVKYCTKPLLSGLVFVGIVAGTAVAVVWVGKNYFASSPVVDILKVEYKPVPDAPGVHGILINGMRYPGICKDAWPYPLGPTVEECPDVQTWSNVFFGK